MSTTIKQNIFQIEKIDAAQLPELQGLKEKQLQIVKENPFVEIIDNKTYEGAKKARTTLVTARTEIQNQDKLIASKIKKFREAVAEVSEELIAITKPHEDKQQVEVKRWEEIKEDERQEKIRLEEGRKSRIRKSIKTIFDNYLMKINNMSFNTIASVKVDFEEDLYKTSVTQFEEFELDFNEKVMHLKNAFLSKIKTLEEKEVQRLENIRLEEERKKIEEAQAKLEADRKAEEERLAKIKAKQDAELEIQRKKIAEEKAKQDAEIAEKQAQIDAENKIIQDEKDRLAKVESDRLAKEKAEQRVKEEAERKAKEAAEAEERAKAEAARLESLKPEKLKAVEFLQSLQYSIAHPKIKDEKLKVELLRSLERIQNSVSDAISVIKNFK